MPERRRGSRTRLALVGALVGLAVTVAAATPAAAGAPTWRLEDYHQSGCFSTNVHDTYYGVYVQGHWTSAIDVGARGLPAGTTYDTSYAPIPPGHSDGEHTLAYVHVTMTTNPPIGHYFATLWATDGSDHQRVTVMLDVRDRCGY